MCETRSLFTGVLTYDSSGRRLVDPQPFSRTVGSVTCVRTRENRFRTLPGGGRYRGASTAAALHAGVRRTPSSDGPLWRLPDDRDRGRGCSGRERAEDGRRSRGSEKVAATGDGQIERKNYQRRAKDLSDNRRSENDGL